MRCKSKRRTPFFLAAGIFSQLSLKARASSLAFPRFLPEGPSRDSDFTSLIHFHIPLLLYIVATTEIIHVLCYSLKTIRLIITLTVVQRD